MPGIITGPGLADIGAPLPKKPKASKTKVDASGFVSSPSPASPFVTKASHDAAFMSMPVAKQQQLLKNAGFNISVDGVIGAQTDTARRAYLRGVSPNVWNHAWTTQHTFTPGTPVSTVPAAPARTTTAAAAPAAAPAASPSQSLLDQVLAGISSYKAPTQDELLAQAKQLADVQLGPQETLIQQEQDQALADAQRRAQLQGQIGAALAGVLKDQGPAVQDDYRAAAADQSGLASGFSGDLRSNAAADAQKINDILASVGAPDAQKIDTSKTDAAANVLYGTGGYLPASALGREGAAFTAAADLLPQTAAGQGAQLAANELQTGTDAKTQLATTLAGLEAQRPGLVSNALAQVQDAATKNAAAAQNQALLPLLLAGKFDALPGVNPITGTKTSKQSSIDNAAASTKLRTLQLGVTEAKLQAQIQGELTTQKEKGATLGLGAKTYQQKSSQALGAARNYHSAWTDANGKTQDPLSWQQYLTHGLNAGIPVTILIKQGRKVYSQAEIKQGLIPGA